MRTERIQTAIELAQKILTVDKANEAAHQHLMFCYSAWGDRAAALDQYEFCNRALREELGIEPSQETRALYEQIRKLTKTKSDAARMTNLPLLKPKDNATIKTKFANLDWGDSACVERYQLVVR